MNRLLFDLALRNVFRQKLRSLMTLTAIVVGVAGLILAGGFTQDIFIQLGEAIIHSQTGHIQVFKQEFIEKGARQPERFTIDNPQEIARQLEVVPGVADVGARLNFAGLLNNGHRDLAIFGQGVEPEKEARLGSFMRITAGRQLSNSDAFGLLIGQGVAHSLALSPGDRVSLVLNAKGGALNSLEFTVVGIFQSFSKEFDSRAIRIPLAAAQELMSSGGVNLLVVRLDATEQTDQVFSEIRTRLAGQPQLEARNWRQLSDFYDKTVDLYSRQFSVMQWIVLFMVLLSVINSVNMSTFERLSEFGTLRALGNTPRAVFQLLILENVILGFFGATLGVVIGAAAAGIISAIGIPMPPPPNANIGYTALIRIVPSVMLQAWLVGFVATVISTILPARRTVRMPIADALQHSI